MKKVAFLLFLFTCFTTINLNAQVLIAEKKREQHPNYLQKGDLSITASFIRTRQTNIQNNLYASDGAELSVLYYLWNRVGLETAFSGHHYNLLKSNSQDTELFDQKNLLVFSERLRYNFWEKSHCGTLFIQTGYSFGKLEGNTPGNMHRWEIASFGTRGSFTRQVIPNLDFEGTFGLVKDNVHNKITKQFKVGLSYNLKQKSSI